MFIVGIDTHTPTAAMLTSLSRDPLPATQSSTSGPSSCECHPVGPSSQCASPGVEKAWSQLVSRWLCQLCAAQLVFLAFGCSRGFSQCWRVRPWLRCVSQFVWVLRRVSQRCCVLLGCRQECRMSHRTLPLLLFRIRSSLCLLGDWGWIDASWSDFGWMRSLSCFALSCCYLRLRPTMKIYQIFLDIILYLTFTSSDICSLKLFDTALNYTKNKKHAWLKDIDTYKQDKEGSISILKKIERCWQT